MYADKSVEDDGELAPDSRTMEYSSTPTRRPGASPMYQTGLSASICVHPRLLFAFVFVSIRVYSRLSCPIQVHSPLMK
jgi:hypothetical protein